MNNSIIPQTDPQYKIDPQHIIPAPEGTTYTVAGMEFSVTGYAKLNGNLTPVIDFPQMSDYKWQYNCLMDRIENPEKYAATGEDVMAKIEHLKMWLIENKHKANPNDPIYNEDIAVKISA